MRKRFVSIILSAVVAASLCPLPASATALEAGSATAPADLGTQASKKTVYVLTKLSTTSNDGSGEFTWGYNYKYNADGLLVRYGSIGAPSSTYIKIAYDGTAPKRRVAYGVTEKYACDKKGRITKCVYTTGDDPSSQTKNVKTFAYDSKGRIEKAKYTMEYGSGDESHTSTQVSTYKHDGKGRVSSCKTESVYDGDTSSSTLKYTYDKKGNLTKISNGSYDSVNKYKDGRLDSRTAWGSTYKYKYAAMKVDASVAAKVKKQQWAILNRDIDCTFAGNSLSPTSAV